MVVKLGGFTLVEMIVSLAILSILASTTLPYVEVTYRRAKESELKQSLRTIRNAIDAFHDDCESGLIVKAQDGVSRDCFPVTLQILVDGVESSEVDGHIRYYLRRIPQDPFSAEEDVLDQWEIRGYRDDPEGTWYGDDVFDVRVNRSGMALDGSTYDEW